MSNNYYTHTTYPAANSQGASSGMRGELDAIMAGFDLLPPPLGVGLQGFLGGTWNNPVITNGTMDGTVIGGSSAVDATFADVLVGGLATLAGGASVAGTLAGQAGAILSNFAIGSSLIDGTPIGLTVPSSVAATTLAASGVTSLTGNLNMAAGAAINNLAGQVELGNPAAVGTPYVDFHSGGASSSYDARIIASGGGATDGQGALALKANAIVMDVRPSWGATPWDSTNLPNPYQSTGGVVTGDVSISAASAISNNIRFLGNGAQLGSIRGNAANGIEFVNAAYSLVNFTISDAGKITSRAGAQFGARPSWQGFTPWDNNNLTALSQLSNNLGFINSGATVANSNAVSGIGPWTYSNAGGSPAYVWGTNGSANFNYLYATNGLSVGFAAQAGTVGGVATPVNSFSNSIGMGWNTSTSPPHINITVDGTLQAFIVANVSDARLKQNVAPTAEDSLAQISAIDFTQFDFIDTGHHTGLGIIAQDAEKIAPDWIVQKDDGGDLKDKRMLNTLAMLMSALHAIQQLNKKVEQLSCLACPATT